MVRWQVVSFCCLGIVALVAVFMLNACGGGAISLSPGGAAAPQDSGAIDPPDNPADVVTPGTEERVLRNTLSLTIPPLARLTPGTEFAVTLGASFIGEVYGGSARIGFDPAVVQPVDSRIGGLVPGSMVHLTGLDQPRHVPFAFTALPGDNGIVDASGELVTVTFRMVGPIGGGQPVYLINEYEFLQLRDRQGQRLGFDLETRSEVR